MDKAEIEALIRLIDDEDEEIYRHVSQKLEQVSPDQLHILEEHSLRSQSELQHQRITHILNKAHLLVTKKSFKEWIDDGSKDLFEGYFLVAKYRYPDLDRQPIVNYIDKIKLDIWLRLNHKFSQLDNVRVINDVFFGKYRFHGDKDSYFSPDNSYINKVIENRKGNPISLSILYSIVAQKLYLPILGVNLPQHFVLAYKDDENLENDERFNNTGIIPWNIKGEILFYVNAFNGGAVFSKYNIDRFLKQTSLPVEEHFYEPCSNTDIILRVLRNLIHSYEKNGDTERMENVKSLHDFIKSESEKTASDNT